VTGCDDWDRHWSEYAASAARNPAQAFRRRLILRRLADGPPPERLLDIGSGTGDLAAELRKAFPRASLLGLELSREGVEIARKHVPEAVFLQRDLTQDEPDPEHLGWATHAVCSEVLEHVDDPVLLLERSRAYMREGCRLVVTVPGGPMTAYDHHIGHRKHFSPQDLADALRAAGFETIEASGAGFPFFNLYRLLIRALGERVTEVAGTATPSLPARFVMSAFDLLLRSVTRSRRGWQTIATARLAGAERSDDG
jgi:trans-aconitate methyltransferase